MNWMASDSKHGKWLAENHDGSIDLSDVIQETKSNARLKGWHGAIGEEVFSQATGCPVVFFTLNLLGNVKVEPWPDADDAEEKMTVLWVCGRVFCEVAKLLNDLWRDSVQMLKEVGVDRAGRDGK